MSGGAPAPRATSAVDAIAERWTNTLVELSPTTGTYIGYSDADTRMPDLSPDGAAALNDAARTAAAELRRTPILDRVDEITARDLGRDLDEVTTRFDAGWHLSDLNVIASPAQELREVFDLMPHDSADDWEVIATRLERLPEALVGYASTLRAGEQRTQLPAIRQVKAVIEQCSDNIGPDGFFSHLISHSDALPTALRNRLSRAAAGASLSYEDLQSFLTTEIAPVAPTVDAVGRERYEIASRGFLGATVDLDESYEWGLAELEKITQEQLSVAHEILPGARVPEVVTYLDSMDRYALHGTDALRNWMQSTSDAAVAALGESEFDIAPPLRTLECLIAPTHTGGIYYTGPSDDFSRPGRMWWSVPEGVNRFSTWRERTTVYHEGVPGHHLQIAQAVYNRQSLNSWRRLLAGTSGHAEGWALYAERLMDQLGFLDDPADRFGMLDAQRMRAARVAIDIGVHLSKTRPDGHGRWDANYALDFLRQNVTMDDAFVRFEIDRYLGWPGQAPSYALGQRIWSELREDFCRAAGPAFDPQHFHRDALAIGGVGLDTLRFALAPDHS